MRPTDPSIWSFLLQLKVAWEKQVLKWNCLTIYIHRIDCNEIQSQQDMWWTVSSEISNIVVPLDVLATGDWAEVAEVTGEPQWVCRMAELGLRIGCQLQVVQAGCPCLLRIGGGRLCLRGTAPEHILVRPVHHPG